MEIETKTTTLCEKIECGFTNTYFGLSQMISYLSIILFNSNTGMNESDDCLYNTIQKFVRNNNFDEEEKRFTRFKGLMTYMLNRNPISITRFYLKFYELYNFDKFKEFITIMSKVKTTGNKEQNIPLEYEIIKNLVVENQSSILSYINMAIHDTREIVNFMNMITYTLTNKYIEISVLNKYTQNENTLGYLLCIDKHIIPLYRCKAIYTYIDWGIIFNKTNFNEIITKYEPTKYNYRINFCEDGMIYAVDKPDKNIYNSLPRIDRILEISNSDNLFLEPPQTNRYVSIGYNNPRNINIEDNYYIITFDYQLANYADQYNINSNNYWDIYNIYSMLASNDNSIIFGYVKQMFKYIDSIETTKLDTTIKKDYDNYIQQLTSSSKYDFSKTNKSIIFIRNIIGCILRESFRLISYKSIDYDIAETIFIRVPRTGVENNKYASHREISEIPDLFIHLCYLMYLYSFRKNEVTIFYDNPAYIVLMREMFMSKNLDIRRIDADICLMRYRYTKTPDEKELAKTNILKYKSVLCKFPRANKLVKDVFLPVFGESFTTAWQSNP